MINFLSTNPNSLLSVLSFSLSPTKKYRLFFISLILLRSKRSVLGSLAITTSPVLILRNGNLYASTVSPALNVGYMLLPEIVYFTNTILQEFWIFQISALFHLLRQLIFAQIHG